MVRASMASFFFCLLFLYLFFVCLCLERRKKGGERDFLEFDCLIAMLDSSLLFSFSFFLSYSAMCVAFVEPGWGFLSF